MPKGRGRNAHNDAKQLAAKDWRKRAYNLRLQGFSLREIARRVGHAHTTVDMAIKEALDAVPVEDVERMRKLEVDRIDRAMRAIWPHVKTGEAAAILSLVRLQERRSRYAGLDKAVQVKFEIDDAVEKFIAQMKAKLSPELFEQVLSVATNAGQHGPGTLGDPAGEDEGDKPGDG